MHGRMGVKAIIGLPGRGVKDACNPLRIVLTVILLAVMALPVAGVRAVDQLATLTLSNISNSRFTVSWETDSAVTGWVEYGTNPANLTPTYDVRGQSTSSYTHYVNVGGLTNGTTYYFDVISGGNRDSNNEAHYTIATGPTLGPPGTDTIYGQVFEADGTTLAEGAIVYITATGGQLLSAIVEDSGFWNINLGEMRKADLSGYLAYTDTTTLSLTVTRAIEGTASKDETVANARQGTNMTLQLPPTVTNVISTNADDTYRAYDVLSIKVQFSSAVTVTGTPILLLETGTVDRVATYASGSGTTTLTFAYTVQSGDNSPDLDYVAANSLRLNGGTIKDTAGNDAILTLPAPGAAHSLGANNNIVIDATTPSVVNVTSTQADGIYKAGETIPITVVFSDVVIVTGTPHLWLETGVTDRMADYVNGSDTDTLTFSYTVYAGDNSSDLDYVATNSLSLSAGTIKDALGNDAVLTLPVPGAPNSLGANKALVIDTSSPAVTDITSSKADGIYKAGELIPVIVAFNEIVNITGTPQLDLALSPTIARQASYTSGTGTNNLTFDYTVQAGDNSPDLDYIAANALTLNGGTIQDTAGNDATLTLPAAGAVHSLAANKNLIIDTTAPTVTDVTSPKADGSYKAGTVIPITIAFSEAVIATGTPKLGLETGLTNRTAVYATGSATSILIFNYTVQPGDASADLDYLTANSLGLYGGTILDTARNDAILTLPDPGAPRSLGANKNLVIDTAGPRVTNVTSPKADGTYKAGVAIPISVTFNEVLVVSGVPQLELETGDTDRIADCVAGTGTKVLTFSYTVRVGDYSPDLDYLSSNSLTLNGGTIRDIAGNDAVLTLPAPGSAHSLSANKNLVIDTRIPPVVTTDDAQDVTTSRARLSGNLTFLGSATSVIVSLQWGVVSTVYLSETAPEWLTATGTFNADLAGLAPGTTYYFRAVAIGDNTGYGEQKSFTTTLPGDANADGVINAIDITKVERILAGLDVSRPGADANQDGTVDALDVTTVERKIGGLQ